jgi:DNA-binding FadR family transcriptional regulator
MAEIDRQLWLGDQTPADFGSIYEIVQYFNRKHLTDLFGEFAINRYTDWQIAEIRNAAVDYFERYRGEI